MWPRGRVLSRLAACAGPLSPSGRVGLSGDVQGERAGNR